VIPYAGVGVHIFCKCWHNISPEEAIREVQESSTFFQGSKALYFTINRDHHYRTETIFRMKLKNSAFPQLLFDGIQPNGSGHHHSLGSLPIKKRKVASKKEHTHVEQNH
jgi:hypothetical protein